MNPLQIKQQEAWQTMRRKALKRDRNCCQKCHRIDNALQVHHILPRNQGGTDDLENLITLCEPCHLEWESVGLALELSFQEWLPWPPGWRLLTWFIQEDLWTEEKTAKEMRDGLLWVHQMVFEAAGPDESPAQKRTRKERS